MLSTVNKHQVKFYNYNVSTTACINEMAAPHSTLPERKHA